VSRRWEAGLRVGLGGIERLSRAPLPGQGRGRARPTWGRQADPGALLLHGGGLIRDNVGKVSFTKYFGGAREA
jgi:hypothetical protein